MEPTPMLIMILVQAYFEIAGGIELSTPLYGGVCCHASQTVTLAVQSSSPRINTIVQSFVLDRGVIQILRHAIL